MAKLWQKNYSLDTLMEKFTVGSDYLLDQHLVISDALASMAHMKGLVKIGLLTQEEGETLMEGLREVIRLRQRHDFPIQRSDEDCHTAIENFLTERYGDVGKKIHTGRSRNDQVQVALRLWMRDYALRLAGETLSFAKELLAFAKRYEFTPMPGRTHMQIAMPSSVGTWAASFAEELIDETGLLLDLEGLLDHSPLGAAASYGVPLPLDRAYTAGLLGFKGPQRNVLYSVDSRGKFEGMLLDHCDYIALTISKLAQDLMLFTLPELGYFSLPKELTTGSSIMPQKKNPDGLELARSRSAIVDGDAATVKALVRALPSGYNRDFQDTKAPLIEGASTTWLLVAIMARMVSQLEVHEDKLKGACNSLLYATDLVFQRVRNGETFRDAYKDVGLHLEMVKVPEDITAALKSRTSIGAPGNLLLDATMKDACLMESLVKEKEQLVHDAYEHLSGLEGVDTIEL